MAQIILYPERENWEKLIQRPSSRIVDDKVIEKIFIDVERNGDEALKHYTKLFDKIDLQKNVLEVEEEIEKIEHMIDDKLKTAIKIAYENIFKFHKETILVNSSVVETTVGVKAWRKLVPIESVGLYIPGGNAPLFSTLLMLAIPAKIAGCQNIVVTTPPSKDGSVHPAIVYTAYICGIKRIFLCGGAQAIAALAIGTETIPKTYKIFGPGNAWVTRAKQWAFQYYNVALDMPAGPSEVLVIADDSANPKFVAADLLSQCEHGPDSQSILVTDSKDILEKVKIEAQNQLEQLPTKTFAKASWENSLLILFENLDQCIEFSNYYAPEHLIIQTRDGDNLVDKVRNAGSVFLGHWSPEVLGDYITGPNHTLPTSGYARVYSGISVESFMKAISFQVVDISALRELSFYVITMAETEGLPAHANAVKIRLNSFADEKNKYQR